MTDAWKAGSREIAPLEGIDISPAADVATGALIQAVEAGRVGKKENILLNITSGGAKRMRQDYARVIAFNLV